MKIERSYLKGFQMKLADAEFAGGIMTDLNKERIRLQADNDRLRAAVAPFLRYYDDIRFNLRKQPRPTDAAIEEHGERDASVTWAEFYALRDACEQKASK